MSDFTHIFLALRAWLALNRIEGRSLHVILNFSDKDEAARFYAAIQREFAEPRDIPTLLEIAGIKIKFETPFSIVLDKTGYALVKGMQPLVASGALTNKWARNRRGNP